MSSNLFHSVINTNLTLKKYYHLELTIQSTKGWTQKSQHRKGWIIILYISSDIVQHTPIGPAKWNQRTLT